MEDFDVRKFFVYRGPNYYLNRPALVFNVFFAPDGNRVDYYAPMILEKFPQLEACLPGRVSDLFAEVLIQVMKMEIDLFINNYAISSDGEEHVLAVEYLDEVNAEDCVYFVSDWFKAMNDKAYFDFDGKYAQLQKDFDRTLFGGPTIYSLIEAGLKRGIPVQYLYEENQFQWGYGRKQIRGRSTTLQVDGIKDTEFTMFKDMVKDFLLMCGFPTPVGKNCFDEEEAVEQALELGFPVVVKPQAGHKGQGVTTHIESEEAVRKAFRLVKAGADELGVSFDGAIVEQQVYGTDHRLLAVGGKFAAALERVPAYVDGNGSDSIERLIEVENDTVARLDNARSPLCKIKIDEDMKDYLGLQGLNLQTVPKDGERIFLRRVANISAGGVSINVTDKIHPDNIRLVEDIASFFNVTCLGIDVLAQDVSKSWRDSDFGIIEINAGPGVFMHLAPALGGSIDVPGMIVKTYFPRPEYARIPIVMGNKIDKALCDGLLEKYRQLGRQGRFGSLTEEGISFDGSFFHLNPKHDENVKIILRHPQTDFAVFRHNSDDLFDHGIWHEGADVVILQDPHFAEEMLARDLLPDGVLIRVTGQKAVMKRGEEELASSTVEDPAKLNDLILEWLDPMLADLAKRYD